MISARIRCLLTLATTVLALMGVAGCGATGEPTKESPRTAAAPPFAHSLPRALADIPATSPGTRSYSPWPSALHDARHSGSATTQGPTSGTVRWRRQLEGPVTPGPVVGADGTIYASSNGGVLHAIAPRTGKDLWTFDSKQNGGGDLSVSPLVLPNNEILFPAPGGTLFALSPAGRRLWSTVFEGTPTSPVTTDGKRVYVGDTSGGVTAMDVSPGGYKVLWRLKVGETSYGSVVTNGSGRLYTTADSSLVAIDDRNGQGRVAWRRDPHDRITEVSAGLAADGTALLGTNGRMEWAYHPDGTLAWHAPRVITYSSPVVTASGLAYVGDHAHLVKVFDVKTGQEVARYGPVDGKIWSSTVVDRDYRVYLGGQNGHVYGFDARGRGLLEVDLGGAVDSYPALTADGALIMGSRNGMLTAIGK